MYVIMRTEQETTDLRRQLHEVCAQAKEHFKFIMVGILHILESTFFLDFRQLKYNQ